jgi:hypothetical protein
MARSSPMVKSPQQPRRDLLALLRFERDLDRDLVRFERDLLRLRLDFDIDARLTFHPFLAAAERRLLEYERDLVRRDLVRRDFVLRDLVRRDLLKDRLWLRRVFHPFLAAAERRLLEYERERDLVLDLRERDLEADRL